ncbi:helix-hairpin-helix domain-containing protein [Nocardioides solisilvae]|uniref:helix-hairpin-helix domain-containing protein n=1 Tax=Nocardioides solisilvae TaxID=1542435 RepID=UPI000D74362D|nr:helix-hairpin-helix domain-containing protein [Nocardioides solisilvae]
MRSRRPSPEHEQAVARRLALLSAELAAVRAELPPDVGDREVVGSPGPGPGPGPVGWADVEPTRVRPSGGPGEEWLREQAQGSEPDPWADPLDDPARPARPAGPAPGALPVPGRHAARRALAGPWLPVRGRVTLQPSHLVVVAALVAVGLAWTTWWVVAGQPRTAAVPPRAVPSPVAGAVEPVAPVAPPVAPPVPGGEAAPGPGSATGPAGGQEVVVDVAGRVRRPGLVVLPPGSRVADALEEAGGARAGVDLTSLNLARVLVDGEQLLVGVRVPAGPALASPGTSLPGHAGAGAPAGLVNLNTADEALLDTLPGVGPVTAAAIVAWRTEHGGFTAVDELLEVNGIGEVTLAELAPLVTV